MGGALRPKDLFFMFMPMGRGFRRNEEPVARSVLLALGMLLVPGSVWSAELRFGHPQTPAGAVAVVAHELRTWDRHNLTVQAIPFPAAINTRDAIVGSPGR